MKVQDIITWGRESKERRLEEAHARHREIPDLIEIRFFTFASSTKPYDVMRFERGKWVSKRAAA